MVQPPPLLEIDGVGHAFGERVVLRDVHLRVEAGSSLALFGPTDPVRWSPLGPSARTLRSEPLGDLGSDRVLAEIDSLLAGEA